MILAQGGYLVVPPAAPFAMYDSQEAYVTGLIQLLREIDAGPMTIVFRIAPSA